MDAEMIRAVALVIGAVGGLIAALASLYNIHLTHEQTERLAAHEEKLDTVVAQGNGMRAELEAVARAQGLQQGREEGLQEGRDEALGEPK